MREFQKKLKYKRVIYSPVFFFILLGAVLAVAHSTWNVYQKKRASEIEAARVQKEFLEFEAKRESLLRDIERLKTNYGVEEEIRDKFNVAKSGENTIIIVNPSGGNGATSTQRSFLGNLWVWVKGLFGSK